MMITLSDGSVWPLPTLESAPEHGVAWVLRYGQPTRHALLAAAQIIEAYDYLVAEASRDKRDLVCREIRQALRDQA